MGHVGRVGPRRELASMAWTTSRWCVDREGNRHQVEQGRIDSVAITASGQGGATQLFGVIEST